MPGRVGAGHQDRVPACGNGVGRRVVGVRKIDASVQEPAKAIAAEAFPVARQHVAAELVDRDLKNQAGRLGDGDRERHNEKRSGTQVHGEGQN